MLFIPGKEPAKLSLEFAKDPIVMAKPNVNPDAVGGKSWW